MSEETGSIDQARGRRPPIGLGPKECQELWLLLSRREWSSMVLVPADPGTSADHVARSLADVGNRLSEVPITAVTAGSLEYGSAMALADLPRFVDRKRLGAAGAWPTVDLPPAGVEEVQDGVPDASPGEALVVSSVARVIISIPPVVSEPLGLVTTQKADLILLCVELGRTSLADARRAAALLGRERLAGCILLR